MTKYRKNKNCKCECHKPCWHQPPGQKRFWCKGAEECTSCTQNHGNRLAGLAEIAADVLGALNSPQ